MPLYQVVLVLCLLTPVVVSFRDCNDIYSRDNYAPSGVYTIYPDGGTAVNVYCDMDTDGGGWTVFQRRMDGTVSFYRPWEHYKRGFGTANGEYWLGLENLYHLTNRRTELRVDMEDFSAVGRTGFAQYASFEVDSEAYGYMLHVDRFQDGGAGDSLSAHDGKRFSTPDQDHDGTSSHCAKDLLGGFWYQVYIVANPNGIYLFDDDTRSVGIRWASFKNASLKSFSMKIRPQRRREDQDENIDV